MQGAAAAFGEHAGTVEVKHLSLSEHADRLEFQSAMIYDSVS